MTTQTRLRGGAEGNPPVEEPGTGEEPGGDDPAEPEYPIDLGTDSVKVPEWADGDYTAMSGGIGLSVKDGNFTVSMKVFPRPIVDSLNINDIESQTTDDEKKIYTLNAVVNVDLTSSVKASEPTEEKIYSSFVMQLTDSGIDVTITSEDPVLSMVAGKTINFTRETGSTE